MRRARRRSEERRVGKECRSLCDWSSDVCSSDLEPTVGLDPRIRHELLDVIGGLRARREVTILLTTHYLDEAERLCDRIAVMHSGRIAALGTPAELCAELGEDRKSVV